MPRKNRTNKGKKAQASPPSSTIPPTPVTGPYLNDTKFKDYDVSPLENEHDSDCRSEPEWQSDNSDDNNSNEALFESNFKMADYDVYVHQIQMTRELLETALRKLEKDFYSQLATQENKAAEFEKTTRETSEIKTIRDQAEKLESKNKERR
ncbi:hypothetical protein BDD12DRAFT_881034 [Trichophaea hybrida]|nr:hypothetical protein BDD12DRAFT_881034 [Trichophaea hybrida]